jgi:hypothetical protein
MTSSISKRAPGAVNNACAWARDIAGQGGRLEADALICQAILYQELRSILHGVCRATAASAALIGRSAGFGPPVRSLKRLE